MVSKRTESIKSSKVAKFERVLFKTGDDIALQSRRILQTYV